MGQDFSTIHPKKGLFPTSSGYVVPTRPQLPPKEVDRTIHQVFTIPSQPTKSYGFMGMPQSGKTHLITTLTGKKTFSGPYLEKIFNSAPCRFYEIGHPHNGFITNDTAQIQDDYEKFFELNELQKLKHLFIVIPDEVRGEDLMAAKMASDKGISYSFIRTKFDVTLKNTAEDESIPINQDLVAKCMAHEKAYFDQKGQEAKQIFDDDVVIGREVYFVSARALDSCLKGQKPDVYAMEIELIRFFGSLGVCLIFGQQLTQNETHGTDV